MKRLGNIYSTSLVCLPYASKSVLITTYLFLHDEKYLPGHCEVTVYTGFQKLKLCQRDTRWPCLGADALRTAMNPVQELLTRVMTMLPWFSAQIWVPEDCWVKYSTNNTSLLLNYLKEPASKGWGYGWVIKHILSMYEALGLIPSPWTLRWGVGEITVWFRDKEQIPGGLAGVFCHSVPKNLFIRFTSFNQFRKQCSICKQ